MKDINIDRILDIIENFSNTSIAVIGDYMIDEYIFGDVERISPEAPVPIVLYKDRKFSLGGAGNVANNIASLGGKVYNIGVIGDDNYKEIFFNLINKENFNNEGILIDETRPTIRKTRIIAQNQQLLRIDYEKTDFLSNTLKEKISQYINSIIHNIDGIIISDYGKGLFDKDILEKIIKISNDHNKFIAVDPKDRNFYNYKGATISTPNHKEASRMVGRSLKTQEEIKEAGFEIIEKLGFENLLITQGAEGMTLFEKGKSPLHIPSHAKQVFDVTGAGDTVISALTLAKASGATLPEASFIANIAAGIVVGKLGSATATIEEIIEEVKRY